MTTDLFRLGQGLRDADEVEVVGGVIVFLGVVRRQRRAKLRVRLRVVVRDRADGDAVEGETALQAVHLLRRRSRRRPVDLILPAGDAPSRGGRLPGAARFR